MVSSKSLNFLLLVDKKVSSLNQVVGLADSIIKKSKKRIFYKVYEVNYNFLNFLPSHLIYLFSVLKIFKIDKQLNDYTPDLIISCGRISAPLNLILKKKNNCLSIHIQDPYIKKNFFDKIILPRHDKKNFNKNIIRTTTNFINEKKKKIDKNQLKIFEKEVLINNSKENLLILIGGNTFSSKFLSNKIHKLIFFLKKLQSDNLNFYFLYSRRTPKILKQLIKENFSNNSYIWNEIKLNPYWFLLKNSNHILVTSDSVAMTSEAVSTKKPVYIFNLSNLKKKVMNFQNALKDLGITKPFNGTLSKWNYNYHSENERVSQILIDEFNL